MTALRVQTSIANEAVTPAVQPATVVAAGVQTTLSWSAAQTQQLVLEAGARVVLNVLPEQAPAAARARVSIQLAEGAQLRIHGFCVAAPDAAAEWSIQLGRGAQVDAAFIVHSLSSLELGQARDVATDPAATPAAKTTNFALHVESTLADDARAQVQLLSLAAPHARHDLNVKMVHAGVRSASSQSVRAVVCARGRSLFRGTVVVKRGAQKTKSEQQHKALLMAHDAVSLAMPELQIDANDVACSHGSTTGQLDADQLFYLRARGIEAADARAMLVDAFAEGVLLELPAEILERARQQLRAHLRFVTPDTLAPALFAPGTLAPAHAAAEKS